MAASAQSLQSTVQRLSTLLQSAGTNLRSVGINDPTGAQQSIARM
jgi:RND superfamily putative drug exporter